MTAKKSKQPLRLISAVTGQPTDTVDDRILAVLDALNDGEFLVAIDVCERAHCGINSLNKYAVREPLVSMRIASGRKWLYVNRATMAAYRAEQKGRTA